MATKRGLYFVGESRSDVAPTVTALRATVVDPGFCKPVHVASVCTHSAAPLDDAEHWHLTEEEWMSASGRARAQAAERRRRDGTEWALESLSGTGRASLRRLSSTCTRCYARARGRISNCCSQCGAVAAETVPGPGRLCDRLFDRSSTRPVKNQPSVQNQPSTTAGREELRRRLMEVRRRRQETPTVVFFGDASYGPSLRGHNPKKGLLRELCHRGFCWTRPPRCALAGTTNSRRRATASALTKAMVRLVPF